MLRGLFSQNQPAQQNAAFVPPKSCRGEEENTPSALAFSRLEEGGGMEEGERKEREGRWEEGARGRREQ